MTQQGLRCGVAVVARRDPRLTRATLASVRALRHPPDRIALVVSKARAHLAADVAEGAMENGPPVDIVTVADDADAASAAVAALAPHADIAVVAPEGVALAPDSLDAVRGEAERYADLVGAIDLVHQNVTIDANAERDGDAFDWPSLPAERPAIAALRALIGARSLMGAVFWARIATLAGVAFARSFEAGDLLTFLPALDALQARGRVVVRFTAQARRLRLHPERRSGFDAGYGLCRKLYQIEDQRRAEAALRGPSPALFSPQFERLRLFAEQGLRAGLSRANRSHARTFLAGALAARRDARAVRRSMQRELRAMR